MEEKQENREMEDHATQEIYRLIGMQPSTDKEHSTGKALADCKKRLHPGQFCLL